MYKPWSHCKRNRIFDSQSRRLDPRAVDVLYFFSSCCRHKLHKCSIILRGQVARGRCPGGDTIERYVKWYWRQIVVRDQFYTEHSLKLEVLIPSFHLLSDLQLKNVMPLWH